MKDAGLALVEAVYRRMRIEDEWAIRTERGFTWWCGPLAQRIWAEPPFEDDGFILSEVHAETDLIGVSGWLSEDVDFLAAASAPYATMSGMIGHDGQLRSATKVYVHDETLGVWDKLFGFAAMLQAGSAHWDLDWLLEVPDARAAASEHPASGPRELSDLMLKFLAEVVLDGTEEPLRFTAADLRGVKAGLEGLPGAVCLANEETMTATWPWRSGLARLSLATHEPHVRLGTGLAMTLRLPVAWPEEERGLRAIELNMKERSSFVGAPLLGSWSPDPDRKNSMVFNSFIPNYAHIPGITEMLAFHMVARAKWVERVIDTWGGGARESPMRAGPLDWRDWRGSCGTSAETPGGASRRRRAASVRSRQGGR